MSARLHPRLEAARTSHADGDHGPLIAIALEARMAASRCCCDTPILEGDDLMCRACLCENDGQVEKRMERARTPHRYQPHRSGLCDVCARWPDDPLHDGGRDA